MMNKKVITLIVALFVLTMIIVAYSGQASFFTFGKNDTAKPVTIRIAAWNTAADALKAEIEGFEKKYPNIKIEIQYVNSSYTKIMPRLSVPEADLPDIIQVLNRDFPAFSKKYPGNFLDITDKTKELKEKFVTSSWEPVTEQGKVYAMPWDLGPTAVYYRKDLFQQAGVDPSKIETWAEYIEAGKKIKQHFNGAVAMTGISDGNIGDFDTYELLFNELGGNYMTQDGKIEIASVQSKQALELLKKMMDEGVAIDVKDWNGRIEAMKNSKTASVIYPVWFAGTIMNSMPDQKGKWGIMPLPAFTKGGNHQSNGGGSVLAISKRSKNQEAAWKFIEYCLTTDEGQSVMMKFGLFPSYKPFYDNPSFKENNAYFEMPIYQFFAERSEKIPSFRRGPIMLDSRKVLSDMITAVFSGQNAEQASMKAAQEISNQTGLVIKQ